MRVILIDDEQIALEVLDSMLSEYKGVEIVGRYTHPIVALQDLKHVHADVIFMDIEMGEINGLEIAEKFMDNNTIEIVFITAYSQYAVDAFEINAMDYLLKPIQEKRLEKTILRLKKKIYQKSIRNISKDLLENNMCLNSLGRFQVFDSQGEPIYWRTKKTKELFAYLWLKNGNFINKMIIIETIFPEKNLEKGTTLLHTTIYQLRKSLEKLGFNDGIVHFNEGYKLNIPIKSDIEELKYLKALEKHTDEEISAILRLYQGDFLEEEGYIWAAGIQQRYKSLVFDALERYASLQLETGRYSVVLENCLRQMHKMDSFNDAVIKMIIEYLGRQNKIYKLESFFNDYVENLWSEIKLNPMKDTIDLYKSYIEN